MKGEVFSATIQFLSNHSEFSVSEAAAVGISIFVLSFCIWFIYCLYDLTPEEITAVEGSK